jgi:RNA polymerase sigma-70 factor (ECF subfamily)
VARRRKKSPAGANYPMNESVSALHTRPSLLVRLQDRADGAAWRTFVDVYAPVIYGYCRRKGCQEADAADVTQDVLGEVARGMPAFEYQPQRGRFRDWLSTITRRCLSRFLQKQNRQPPAGLEGEGEAAAADADWLTEFHSRLLAVALEQVRPRFEPATWQAFEQTWLQGHPAPAAAASLGVPVETIYVAKSRVLAALRDAVLELADDCPLPLS